MITGEFDLIRSIRELVKSRQGEPDAITGIGDDCAVYLINEGRYGLFSTDMSLEDVHFNLSYCSYHDAGYRSMSASISDIYAMGGRPLMAFVSLGIPPSSQTDDIMEIYNGMIDSAAKVGVFIAGGDTVSSGRLIISISVYGETASPVMRSGAAPGDFIYLTGSTGGSLLGLELLKSGAPVNGYPESSARHLRPEPCGRAGQVVSIYSPGAMIDISDGLIADLDHICEESACGYELYADGIPVPPEVSGYCRAHSLNPLDYALRSGEEYELIFTSKQKIESNSTASLIGKIIPEGKFIIINNNRSPVTGPGFDHFKRTV